jgi:cell division septation protein DedD
MTGDRDHDLVDESPEREHHAPRAIFSPSEFRVWLGLLVFGVILFVAAPYLFREARRASGVSSAVPAPDASRPGVPSSLPSAPLATPREPGAPGESEPGVQTPSLPRTVSPPAPTHTVTPSAPAAPKTPAERYWVQVAALRDADGARNLMATLSAQQFPVDEGGVPPGADGQQAAAGETSQPSTPPRAGELYLVRIGAFTDRAAAVAALERLKELGYAGPFITRAR